ncbi:MAG TPA: adenosylcobalamin-dependent ribonucleoside-diphosphate reductase [Candidatus Saccharimonadales bacterium]|nr:adenosylcobalamin-dependent ribonucleoside-diphosphate reductase [Candidatus Saccharimonadales bacterium]
MTATIELERLTKLDARIQGAFAMATIFEPPYNPNSLKVFNKRYPRKDDDGEPTESPAETHWRVNVNVASVTVLYVEGADWEEGDVEPERIDLTRLTYEEMPFPYRTIVRQFNWQLEHGRKLKSFWDLVENGIDDWLERAAAYYEMTSRLIFIPNSPTWTGAGTPLGQLAACFVLPIEDTLVDGYANIMKTVRDAVAIQKTGGGNGFSFGRLRPEGSIVRSSMGQSTGVVGYLRMYNAVFEEIRQGGSRRGANMGVCPIWHPDALAFIRAKVEEGLLKNFNISVGVTDRFLEAVENNSDWNFHFPGPDGPVAKVEWKGEKVTSIPARELWDYIVRCAWEKGDPGLLFIDEANRFNPCPTRYTLESTNPCGEQWLAPYENCCLGSIAIQNFVREDGSLDWGEFDRYHRLAYQMLDDVVDANGYVPSVPELEFAAQNGRRVGLGEMGVADAMVKVFNPGRGAIGVRYGSEDGLDFASQVAERMRFISMMSAIERAEERGAFPWIANSIYDPALLREHGFGAKVQTVMDDGETPCTINLWETPKPLVEHKLDFGRPPCNWQLVEEGLLAHGIRNSATNTFAPTGTIASTAGVEGYGGECMFALIYKRIMMQEAENIELSYVSSLLEEALRREGFDENMLAVVAEAVAMNNGSCQGLDSVPESVQYAFVVAADLTPAEHVMTQAALQAFVDNSISKTINFANAATVEDVNEAYHLATRTRCKGITIYRQGSRDLEVLSVSTETPETGELEVLDEAHWPFVRPLPLPDYISTPGRGLPTIEYAVRTPFGKLWVDVCELREHPGRPYHIRCSIGKSGEDIPAFMEAIGRLFSWGLRLGGDVRDGADAIMGIGGSTREEGLRPERKALSIPDALGHFLLQHADAVEAAITAARDEASETQAQVSMITEVVALTPTQPVEEKAVVETRGNICPECRSAQVIYSEGCQKCANFPHSCTYNKCG